MSKPSDHDTPLAIALAVLRKCFDLDPGVVSGLRRRFRADMSPQWNAKCVGKPAGGSQGSNRNRQVLRQGLQRLAGISGQAVFEMKQAMGGGKTHSMLSPDITSGFKPVQARVVAISGRSVSRDEHLWGDVAEQLGKADQFAEFFKGAPKAPNEKDWVALIGDEPTLILLDEIPPYFGYAVTQPVGGGTLAEVATLTSRAATRARLSSCRPSSRGRSVTSSRRPDARPRRSRPSNSAPMKSTTSCGLA
jgi:hypothetical protein